MTSPSHPSSPAKPPELADHPFAIKWPVQWGDQDAFGHVNNVVYFRWMESARIEYFNAADFGASANNQGIGPILASIKCDFRRQLLYPDTLLISASVVSIGRTSLKMVHRVYSTAQQAIAAEGDSVIVMFDYQSQKPVPVSAEIRAKVAALEGRPVG
jgi:acyl-CoA thioester hydrolase